MTVRLVVFGRQGAGKGTQCELLATHYTVPHVSTGDMLRAAVEAGTEVGERAKSFLDAGHLVPDDVMGGVVAERLGQPDAAGGFLLDGYPRTLAQAEILTDILQPAGIDVALNIDVPLDVVRERLLARGRDDDTPEAIERRLGVYDAETVPVIELYAERKRLINVDGVGEVADVFDRAVAALEASGRIGS